MITRLTLVRHAKHAWQVERRLAGHAEVPLAAEAQAQVGELTHKLRAEGPFNLIYSSPLKRCISTIAPYARHAKLAIHEIPALRERDLGSWEGRAFEDVRVTGLPHAAYDGSVHIPGAEPLADVRERMHDFLGHVLRHHAGERILVSTHAGVLYAFQKYLVANPPTHPYWIENAEFVHIVHDGNRWLWGGKL